MDHVWWCFLSCERCGCLGYLLYRVVWCYTWSSVVQPYTPIICHHITLWLLQGLFSSVRKYKPLWCHLNGSVNEVWQSFLRREQKPPLICIMGNVGQYSWSIIWSRLLLHYKYLIRLLQFWQLNGRAAPHQWSVVQHTSNPHLQQALWKKHLWRYLGTLSLLTAAGGEFVFVFVYSYTV